MRCLSAGEFDAAPRQPVEEHGRHPSGHGDVNDRGNGRIPDRPPRARQRGGTIGYIPISPGQRTRPSRFVRGCRVFCMSNAAGRAPRTYRSNAPMSTTAMPLPLPSFLRGKPKPRWSVGGTPALSPASMAGLPASRAWVLVGPPLLASGPSFGSIGLTARAHDVAVDAVGEAGAAGAVADEVVPLAGEVPGHVRAGAAEIDQVQGDDRVPDAEASRPGSWKTPPP